jgi:hypothetical protein
MEWVRPDVAASGDGGVVCSTPTWNTHDRCWESVDVDGSGETALTIGWAT